MVGNCHQGGTIDAFVGLGKERSGSGVWDRNLLSFPLGKCEDALFVLAKG